MFPRFSDLKNTNSRVLKLEGKEGLGEDLLYQKK